MNKKKILVVIDMQNDFITGVLGTPEAQAIVPKVVDKIKEYKRDGNMIIATQDTHYSDYLGTHEGKVIIWERTRVRNYQLNIV